MTTLDEIIRTLDRIGVADIVLPFILIFTIVFAILEKAKILGENRRFNTLFALVMAMAPLFPYVTGRGPDVITVINRALPNVAVVAIAIIMVLFLIGIWGEEFSFAGKPIGSLFMVFALGAVIYIFGASAGWGWTIPNGLGFLNNRDTQALLISILVFGIIVSYITRDPGQNENRRNFGRRAREFFDVLDGGNNNNNN